MAQNKGYAFGAVTIDKKLGTPARKIVAENLSYLLGHGKDRTRLRAIGNISASHVGRIRRMESAATIDALFEIAKHFATEAWRLLHPTMGLGLGLIPETTAEESEIITEQENKGELPLTNEGAQLTDWIAMLGQLRQDWLTLENHEREEWAEQLHAAAQTTRRRQKELAERIVTSPSSVMPFRTPHRPGGG